MDLQLSVHGGGIMQIQFRGFAQGGIKTTYQVSNSAWKMRQQLERSISAEETAQKQRESVDVQISQEGLDLLYQEQKRQNASQDNTEEYKKQLQQVSNMLEGIKHNYSSKETKSTIEKKQEAYAELIKLQELGRAEMARQQLEAQQLSQKLAKEQEEVDRSNNELLVVLESIEELEEGEQEREEKELSESAKTEETNKSNSSVADEFGASVIQDELHMTETIQKMQDSGDEKLARVKDMMNTITKEMYRVNDMIEDPRCSEDEKAEAVDTLVSRAFSEQIEMYDLRMVGLQEKRDARDINREFMASNHLVRARQAQEEMQATASAIMIQQELQKTIDEYSDELQQRVDELIDERNDMNKPQDIPEEEIESEEVAGTQPVEEITSEEILLKQRIEELEKEKFLKE